MFKFVLKCLSLCFVLFFVTPVFAQEFETVVQETVFNSSDKVVIDKEQIDRSKAPNLTTLLSTQANISVSSTPFQPSSIYLRGGDAGHVLILIDGIPFYDASTIQRSFNLNSLDIRTVEKIEIIKGSQSVTYGGQALSGVISITTVPKAAAGPEVVAEVGSYGKADVGVSVHPELGEGVFSARARLGRKDNRSPVLDSSKTYLNENVAADIIYRQESRWYTQGKMTYLGDSSDSPTTDFATFKVIDANDFVIKNQQAAVSISTGSELELLKPQFAVSQQWSHRSFVQPYDAVSNSRGPTDQVYDGEVTYLRADATAYETKSNKISGGASYSKEKMIFRDLGVEKTNAYSELRGVFVRYDQTFATDFEFLAGGRWESWDDKEGVSTGQLGLVFQKNTKLEVATGFKAPSLFQLYSSYGNPNLEAEKSASFSLSHLQPLGESMSASLTLFSTRFSNLITTQGSPPNVKYYNIAEAVTNGVEAAYNWSFLSGQSVSLVAGYQEPWDETNKRWLLRRPIVTGSARYSIADEVKQAQLELVGVGSKADRMGPTSYGELPGYLLVNISGGYKLSQNVDLSLRIDNLTDVRFQESYTYYSEGFAATLGLAARF